MIISIKKLPPSLKIVLCFLAVIITGMLLLLLPISHAEGETLSFVDAFLISTSAVCVTGLVPVVISTTLSVFGKIVLALLIQIGGLGFVTLAVFILVALGMKIGIAERFLVKEALNQKNAKGIVKLVKSIVLTTLTIELIGTFVNLFVFAKYYPFFEALGISAFHSISSFNNAGFDILGAESLIGYTDNIILNLSTTFLIILGGIGFIVIQDVLANKSWKKLSIHSKIVLKTSLFLIVFGTLFFLLSEGDNITFMQAYFQSVTARTAGFMSVDIASMNDASIFVMIALMFIGASSCSTGGGIKTGTAYVIVRSLFSFSRGKKTIVCGREITTETKMRAFLLVAFSMFAILFVALLLLVTEKNATAYDPSYKNLIFETVSAFGTVGLSLNITPLLSPVSKLIICLMMFIGRLGPLTIFSIFNKNWNKIKTSSVDYIEEKLIIG